MKDYGAEYDTLVNLRRAALAQFAAFPPVIGSVRYLEFEETIRGHEARMTEIIAERAVAAALPAAIQETWDELRRLNRVLDEIRSALPRP